MFCFFIHPVNRKSTGEKTGGVVSEPRFFIKPRIGIRCTRNPAVRPPELRAGKPPHPKKKVMRFIDSDCR